MFHRSRLTWSLIGCLLLAGCGAAQVGPSPPALVDAPVTTWLEIDQELIDAEALRIVLVGDTGEASEERDQILDAIRSEEKDLVAVLGDLVYRRAPRCPGGSLGPEARALLDDRIGTPFKDLGAPVLLVLGNHDVVRSRFLGLRKELDPTMEACLLRYGTDESTQGIHLPSRHYAFQAGPVAIAAVSSTGSYLDQGAASMTRDVFGRDETDWNLLLAHHVYRTFSDKASEHHLRDWVQRYDLGPDIVGNGHAHLLQMGIYDGILAVTSGGGSKRRPQRGCLRGDPASRSCGPGQLFGSPASFGYAVLEFTEFDALVTFKDRFGEPFWACRVRQRGQCDLEPLP